MFVTNAQAEIATTQAKTDWASISNEITAAIAKHTHKEIKEFEREMQQFANSIASNKR